MKIPALKNRINALAFDLQSLGKILLAASILILPAAGLNAQSTVNYSFTTNTAGSLTDMSSGTTTLITANSDDVASAVTNIGFDCWFQGIRYTQFSVNSNGLLRLGAAVVQLGSPYKPLGQAGMPLITAYGADQRVHTTGKIHYKITGAAPNRILIIEWLNMQADYNTGGTADLTYQVRLYETTGVIENEYGSMNMSVAGAADVNSKDPHIGFSSGNVTTAIGTVTAPQSGIPAPTYDGTAVTAATNLYTAGAITVLNSAAQGARRIFIYTPPVPAAPTALSFTAVTLGGMTLNWTDNASNEVGYVIYRSTDAINYNFIAQVAAAPGTGTIVSSVQSGLSGSTLYYWKVFAVTEGALSTSLDGSQSTVACSVAGGTYTVGPTGTYASLTAALAALSANGLAGPVILELQDAYLSAVETFPITFTSMPCMGPVNTLTIRPEAAAVGLSITSANTVATIDINGGKYVFIDGRPGGTGTVKQLTISNTSIATGGSAIRIINDGSNNSIKYTLLKASFPSPTSGVVVFSTTTGANGNDNNTIDNCDIDGGAAATASPTTGVAQNGIYSLGTTTAVAQYNSGNTISNCNIFNNFVTGAPATCAGILLLSGNTTWTLNANHIYQTNTRTSTASATMYGISISSGTSGVNFTITNNFIGGSAAGNTGAPFTVTGSFSNRFNGIGLSVGTTAASSVQGNTISNFSFTSTSGATSNSSSSPLGTGIWGGIMIAAGNVNVGNVTGNTIGAPTGNGSILVTGSNSGGTVNGIGVNGTGTMVISNNTVGSITTTGITGSAAPGIIGIQSSSAGTVTINANTIGSIVSANSINASNPSTGTTASIVTGINNTGTATAINITNNTIANLNDAYLPVAANGNRIMAGILSTGGINTITGNTIRNLGTAANAIGTGSAASVIGISLIVATEGLTTVSQNNVSALTNNHATAATAVTGIYYTGPATLANIVARNRVHNLSLATTNTAADIRGINFISGLTTIQNNFIRLGYDTAGVAISNNIPITGLYETAGTAGSGIYFNSVFIGGTVAGTQTGNTFAFRTEQATVTRTFENNIFMNARSNATTGGKHYAIRAAGTVINPAGLNLNYNNYLVTGTGGILGFYNGLDVASLPAWRTAVGQDLNSISGNPQFIDATGVTPNLHIHATNPSTIESAGINIIGITDDFDGENRSSLTPTDIGADAGNFVILDISSPLITYTTLGITCNTGNRNLTATITDVSGVPTSGSFQPRIYYRKNAGAWFSSAGVLSSGTATNGIWTFTIVAADMSGINSPDVISYYVIAQDIAAIPNISSNPGLGLVATDVNNVTNPPTSPNSYSIKYTMAGTYTVGVAGTYPTLTAAVAVYNSSCISGAVVFELLDATYPGETFPITINANADASAVNTLKIKPAAGVNAALTANSTTSVILLNGADYITIDGSNNGGINTICPPGVAGRNLIISNTNASTVSAVVWLQSGADSNAATHNTIRNCNIYGNSSTTTLFGIGSGSATISTRSLGLSNNNNTYENNNIRAVQIGIYSQGSDNSYHNSNTVINQNVMNFPSGSNQNIRIAGIMTGFETNISISGNTISSVSGSTADAFGIACGSIAVSNAVYSGNEVVNATITFNKIDSIRAANSFSVSGIFICSSGSSGNNLIYNNSISNIVANGTIGDFGTGIFIGETIGTTGIYYNSVSISGILAGGSEPNFALAIGGNDPAVIVKNNVLTAQAVIGSTTSTGRGEYAIGFAYSTFNGLVSNYNDLFTAGAEAKFAKTGSLAPGSGTDIANLADLRAATSEEVSSISADPVFNGPSNLRPQTGSPLTGAGFPVTVTNDILCVNRGLATPSIGAYEIAIDVAAPVITYPSLSGTCLTANRTITATITDVSGVPTTGILQPRIYYKKNNGSWFSSQGIITAGTASNGTWDFTIIVADMSGVVSSDVISYFIIAQDVAAIPNIGSNPSAGLVATNVNTVTTPPTTPNTYLIQNTLAPGTYTVGTAGTYLTLTAAINAYNNSCLAGPLIFELTDAVYNEAGAMTINANVDASNVNTLTIRPASGINPSVTAAVANGPVLKILGKYITIDGSNNGSASRNLSFTNGSVTYPNVLWIGSSGNNPVTNVVVKNCVITNGVNTSTAVFVCNGTVGGIPGYFSNITLQNNSIQKSYIGICAVAVVSPNNGNGLNINSNNLASTGTNAISYTGIYVEGVDGATVNNNTIGNFDGSNNEDDKGIWIANGTVNSSVSRNRIADLIYTGTGGYASHGIYISAAIASANDSVINNSIANLSGDGWDYTGPFGLDNSMGIALIGTQSGVNVYFNSINLQGNTLNQLKAMSMGIYAGAGTVANIRNNIIVNNLGLTGTRAVYGSAGVYAVTANTQFSAINYNDYFVNPSGSGNKFIGQVAGVGSLTIAAWRTATGQDLNSIAGNPLYTSATNLALLPGSPAIGAGVSIPGITVDINGATRGNPPNMGAYEGKVVVIAKIFLQGAYRSALSRHKDVTPAWAAILNANALTQPYNTAAFGNYNGNEMVTAGFFTSTGATTDILDWVLIELRDATTPSTVIARRAAFIREDGLVVDLDGTSAVSLGGVTTGNYFIVILQRNHLGVRSANAIPIDGNTAGPATYDFSTAQLQAYQDPAILANPAPNNNPAMKDLGGGKFGLWAGNANGNTTVSFTGLNNDSGALLSALGGLQYNVLVSVYNSADLDLDGTVKYTGLYNDAGVLLSVLLGIQSAVYTQHQ